MKIKTSQQAAWKMFQCKINAGGQRKGSQTKEQRKKETENVLRRKRQRKKNKTRRLQKNHNNESQSTRTNNMLQLAAAQRQFRLYNCEAKSWQVQATTKSLKQEK